MKKAVIIIVVCIVIFGGIYYFTRGNQETKSTLPTYSETKVEKGSIKLTVVCTGQVVSNLDVEIKCKASGEIVKLPFDISASVKKGDLLAELDPTEENRRVKISEVSLSASKARLAQAKTNLRVAESKLKTDKMRADEGLKSAEARASDSKSKAARMKDLIEKKLASQEDYDTAATAAVQAEVDLQSARIRMDELKNDELSLETKREDVTLAETQVETNEIDLSLAQQQLSYTTVVAPIDGVITERLVQIGQIISSGISNVGGGTKMLTLSDLSRMFVNASVDESDIGKVKLDQKVNITCDAFPEMIFTGKVVQIASKGLSSSNVVTFDVKIEVLSENKTFLKPQMTANVEIVAAEKVGALLLLTESIYRKEGKRIVQFMKGTGVFEERPVQVGIDDGTKIEIVSGLNEGDTVGIREGETESRWRGEGGDQRQRPITSSRQMRQVMTGGRGR